MMLSAKQPHSVLVIDDDAVCLELVVTVFQRAGCRTLAARSGTAALRLAAKNRIDLVILDIHIPGTDSLFLAQQLTRASARQKSPACVALTGESSRQKLDEYRASGCSRILVKPAAVSQLVACLELVGENRVKPAYENGVGDHGNSSTLETARALEALDGDLALLEQFRQSFIRELNTMCPVIDHCITEQDFRTAAELVHRLAAAAGYSGAQQLLECCKNLESALVTGNPQTVEICYSMFLAERRQLSYAL